MPKSIITRSLAILLLAMCIMVSYAQSQTVPAFSVASIKRNDSVNANSYMSNLPGGGFSSRFTTLNRLILYAYRLKDYQLTGGPGWANSERYDIDAKADPTLSRDQVRLMIQNLLAERFQLKVRRDKKELSVYALSPSKSGIKFGKASDQPTSAFDVGTGRLTGYGVSMADLADQLSLMLDRPVIDRTGMSGSFDLKLQYSPVENPVNPTSPSDGAGPDILTAVEEQLGLRLEATKAAVDVLVIDL